jgi:hypothetical protein
MANVTWHDREPSPTGKGLFRIILTLLTAFEPSTGERPPPTPGPLMSIGEAIRAAHAARIPF